MNINFKKIGKFIVENRGYQQIANSTGYVGVKNDVQHYITYIAKGDCV